MPSIKSPSNSNDRGIRCLFALTILLFLILPLSTSTSNTPNFLCGDANGEGRINIAGALYISNYVFRGGPPPDPMESGDANADGAVNIGDFVRIYDAIRRVSPELVCP